MPYRGVHAARVIDPSKFKKGSFRRIQIGDANSGIYAIVGKLEGETTMTLQTYRFNSDKFSVAEAKKWLRDNDVKIISFEKAISE